MKCLEPKEYDGEFVELDRVVDEFYNEIMDYVQGDDRNVSL